MLIRHLTAALALVALTIPGSAVTANTATIPSTGQAIDQALNRLAFGPRPGDAERVKKEGLQAWIERQLNPAKIDDSAMNERLARLATLSVDSQTLIREVHQPARRERQRLQREARGGSLDPPSDPSSNPPEVARRRPMNDIIRRDQQIISDLSEAKIFRAVYSDRQLEEVLVDFWFNHFNVFAGKGSTRVWIGEFEREAIRPHVLGNFRTMLGAVAKSPAMQFYLDNRMNVADGINENYARELMELHTLGVDGGYTQQDVVNVARAFTGWGLHAPNGRRETVRLRSPNSPRASARQAIGNQSGFRFNPELHDAGEKTVLGHTIKAGGGMEDGERVLDLLASHPSTATFIAEKLARRFVSDAPPPDLVKRAAARFSATHGDLRETLRVIITSHEFFSAETYRAKVKTPFEFVVSALRVTGSDIRVALPVVRELRELGMPLYLCQPPTGYDDTAATWVSAGALVNRMNFALAMGGSRLRGVTVPFEASAPIGSVRTTLLSDALAGSASAITIATMEKASSVEQTVALALGSPEFQRK